MLDDTGEVRPRRILLSAGLVLVLAGVLVLGYVGWQLYGTTWVAKREQGRSVEAAERVWAPSSADPDEASSDDADLARDVVALIRIPALGPSYVVPAYEGTGDDVLARGFGIIAGSAAPGHVGNVTLAGHRITHGEPLRHMPDLDPGDRIVVETRDTIYTYALDTAGDALTVDLDAQWVTSPDPTDPATDQPVSAAAGTDRLLTLVTCAELLHTDTRLVAFGHLVGSEAR